MNPSYFDVNQGAGFLTHPHLIPMDFEYPIFSETNILQLSLSVDLPRVWVPQTQPQGELGWHVVPLSVQQTYIHYNLIYNIYNIYICSILQYIYILYISYNMIFIALIQADEILWWVGLPHVRMRLRPMLLQWKAAAIWKRTATRWHTISRPCMALLLLVIRCCLLDDDCCWMIVVGWLLLLWWLVVIILMLLLGSSVFLFAFKSETWRGGSLVDFDGWYAKTKHQQIWLKPNPGCALIIFELI